MLSKQKLISNDQRFFFVVSRRFGKNYPQTSDVLHCAAWGVGILPAGEREVFADAQEEVDDIWPEFEIYPDVQNSYFFAEVEADPRADDTIM